MASTAFLPRLFRWGFTILEGILALGALCIALTILVHPSLPPYAHIGPIKRQVGGQALTFSIAPPPGGGPSVAAVQAFDGHVAMTVDHPAGLTDLLIGHGLPLILTYVLFVAVLFDLLRRLFRNVERGESFTPQSVRLVQIVGGALIAFAVVASAIRGWYLRMVFSYLLQHTQIAVSGTPVRLPHISPGPPHFGAWLPFGDSLFWSGLLVLALAEVFRQGLALKRDAELTV
ncbi:MAG TPA: DUF2975 domain-containing protein [Rhizomicrobium sp.]|nr:DUF2975 domain-containing protein [Rhizomicrobium sp.]